MNKTACEFYSAQEIKEAKKLLLESCKMMASRLKFHTKNAAKLDCRDIVSKKLNEVGSDCPTFVAKSVDKLPLATADAFNLANISKDITSVLKIEDHVKTSFYGLSCLWKNLMYWNPL